MNSDWIWYGAKGNAGKSRRGDGSGISASGGERCEAGVLLGPGPYGRVREYEEDDENT
jgi:hypothetical protein